MVWLAKLGDMGYTFLLWLNKKYNNKRLKKGLPYYSLSQEIKNRVKSAVSYISSFETGLIEVARKRECDGIICGHIHKPEIKKEHGIQYLNSGDWVETMSALVEHYDGSWEILYYEEIAIQTQKIQEIPGKKNTVPFLNYQLNSI
jgi:UDP-2,3-diacylglucosamine pyrophosphatase LpxH